MVQLLAWKTSVNTIINITLNTNLLISQIISLQKKNSEICPEMF